MPKLNRGLIPPCDWRHLRCNIFKFIMDVQFFTQSTNNGTCNDGSQQNLSKNAIFSWQIFSWQFSIANSFCGRRHRYFPRRTLALWKITAALWTTMVQRHQLTVHDLWSVFDHLIFDRQSSHMLVPVIAGRWTIIFYGMEDRHQERNKWKIVFKDNKQWSDSVLLIQRERERDIQNRNGNCSYGKQYTKQFCMNTHGLGKSLGTIPTGLGQLCLWYKRAMKALLVSAMFPWRWKCCLMVVHKSDLTKVAHFLHMYLYNGTYRYALHKKHQRWWINILKSSYV